MPSPAFGLPLSVDGPLQAAYGRAQWRQDCMLLLERHIRETFGRPGSRHIASCLVETLDEASTEVVEERIT